jgi:hypothetical protein
MLLTRSASAGSSTPSAGLARSSVKVIVVPCPLPGRWFARFCPEKLRQNYGSLGLAGRLGCGRSHQPVRVRSVDSNWGGRPRLSDCRRPLSSSPVNRSSLEWAVPRRVHVDAKVSRGNPWRTEQDRTPVPGGPSRSGRWDRARRGPGRPRLNPPRSGCSPDHPLGRRLPCP